MSRWFVNMDRLMRYGRTCLFIVATAAPAAIASAASLLLVTDEWAPHFATQREEAVMVANEDHQSAGRILWSHRAGMAPT